MDKVISFLKIVFADAYMALYKFISRKLFFSTICVAAIIHSLSEAKKTGLSDQILIWCMPVLIICITIICVTYVTGVAKIDIQANIQGPK